MVKLDERVRVHEERLQRMKMRQIVKSMNSSGIGIEQLAEFCKECDDVDQQRLDKLNKHRKTMELRAKRNAGLKRAKEAK